MFDFYDDSDRRTDLARKLTNEMLAQGLDYSQTYKVFNEGASFDFENPVEFSEWKALNDAKVTPVKPTLVDVRVNSDNEFEDQ